MQLESVFTMHSQCHACKKSGEWDFEQAYWELIELSLGIQHNICENSNLNHSLHVDVEEIN